MELDDEGDTLPVLTLGAHLKIVQAGAAGRIFSDQSDADSRIVNDGAIVADFSGGNLYISPEIFTNKGSITVSNDAALSIGSPTWSNTGKIAVWSGGILALGGAFTTASLAGVTNRGGTIDLNGILTNSKATLTVGSATTGVLTLNSGTIVGGTIVDNGGGLLSTGGTLSGVTYDGTLDLSAASANVHIAGGFTEHGVSGSGTGLIKFTGDGYLYVDGGETLDNATLDIGGTGNPFMELDDEGDTLPVLTLGAHFKIVETGAAGRIFSDQSDADSRIVNDGAIYADFKAGELYITPEVFTNKGSMTVSNGATLNLNTGQAFTNLSKGVLTGGTYVVDEGSMLLLPGSVVTDNASLTLSGADSEIESQTDAKIESTLTGIGSAGTLAILASRNWTSKLDIANAGSLVLGGGIFTAAALANSSKVSGSGVIAGAVTNTGKLEVSSGVLTFTGAVSGAGSAIVAGGTLRFGNAFSENVQFTGKSGILYLGRSATYAATLTGFSAKGATELDLRDIAFTSAGEATFAGTATSGVLTVTDGTHTAKIKLAGDYLGSSFSAADDGHGGVLVKASAAAAQHFASAMAAFTGGGAAPSAPASVAGRDLRPTLSLPGVG